MLCLLAAPALSETCPAAPDHTSALDALIAQAQDAPNEMAARPLANRMWQLWATAPDARAQDLLDRGMRRRAAADYAAARADFEALIAYCPDYAEGYNQRAFVSFLTGDYAAAVKDLDRALALSPRHIAAMSGKALSLLGLRRDDEAQEVLRAALALNPWLSERRFLTEPPGQEL